MASARGHIRSKKGRDGRGHIVEKCGRSALRSPGERTENRSTLGRNLGGERGSAVCSGSDDGGRLPLSISGRHIEVRRGSIVVEAKRYQVVMVAARPVRKRGSGQDGMKGSSRWI